MFYIFALATYVVAGDVDANDLPSQCKDVCAPVVSLTSSCDSKTNDDDTAELNCICKDPRAAKSLPECDACISKFSKDGRDNGMYTSNFIRLSINTALGFKLTIFRCK